MGKDERLGFGQEILGDFGLVVLIHIVGIGAKMGSMAGRYFFVARGLRFVAR